MKYFVSTLLFAISLNVSAWPFGDFTSMGPPDPPPPVVKPETGNDENGEN